MINVKKTFEYIPTAISKGLNSAGKGIAEWLNSTSQNFATWGSNIVTNIGKTMSSWYSRFVGALSSAWEQFKDFMSSTGGKISSWWGANKNWAIPAAIGLAAIGVTATVVATGGIALPAVTALASVGLANGGIVTAPTYAMVGEGADNEAVLPLNQDTFSGIAQGIVENGGGSYDTEKIISALESLKQAILNRPIKLYADNREIARAANAGNQSINRRYRTIASS